MNDALLKCSQAACPLLPVYRFTWPGQDEAAICGAHVLHIRRIASAMGLHVQTIPLTPEQMFAAERAMEASREQGR